MIEANKKQIAETIFFRQLNENAKALVKHIVEEAIRDKQSFKQAELVVIHNINRYSSAFDIPMLKRIIRSYSELVSNPSIIPLLNKDALYLLKTMDVLTCPDSMPKHS